MTALVIQAYTALLLLPGRVAERLHDDERGQTAAEYLGLIVVIAGILAGIMATDIGEVITTEITQAIRSVIGKAGS